ncbi:DUF1566 domain-containing protein [Desulfobulbus sp. TB]|nr:DUF1566 domain-containing protein [Desulfobulbus sp. TB]
MTEKRYAILIASSEYSEESGLSRLRCPENDVRAVDEILCSPDFGQFTKTFVFRNAPSYEILPRLNSVLTGADKDDLILIYFSGHGKRNRLGHLCLATVNTDNESLEATSILASTIKSYFDLSYSQKKILLLDCCYSGAVGEEFARTKGGVDEELQLMSRGQGTFIMTASTGIEVAVEKEGDKYGLFTKHLVQGIRSGEADKDEDGFVDMQELYEYVHDKVREEGAQKPMQWWLQGKGKLLIARSGREAKEQWRKKLRTMLYKLAAQDLGDKDTPSSTKNLWNWLLDDVYDVFAELLLRFIFIGLIVVIGWWSFKQVASPVPEDSMPQKDRTIGQYIDHGNGTITDTKTGLMWKRCSEGLSGVNCEEGKVERYTWDEAVKRFKYVEYAGYSDWRLPTIDELKTLVYCSKGMNKKNGWCNNESKKPTINQQAFQNTKKLPYWSGSPNAGYSDYAWYVLFSNGFSGFNYRYGYFAVRLVRSGQ